MTTTLDASAGVEAMDSTVVAVRVLSPRAAFNRMKIRVLEALRSIRAQAAARKAAIAQFVKPYWEKIPSGLPGFALLASVTHTPVYRWLLRRTGQAVLGAGAFVYSGLSWTGRGIRWLARGAAKMIGWVSPQAGQKADQFILRNSLRVSTTFNKVSNAVATAVIRTHEAASSDKAVRMAHQLGLPLAIAAGVNLVSQGLLAATISAIPVIGLPLAAAITTTRGMGLAAGTIAAISTLAGWNEQREATVVETTTAPEATPVVVEAAAAAPAEEPNVETREVLVGEKTVVIEVKGDLSPEEAQEIAMKHVAQTEADEAKHLQELEAEVAKSNSTAKQHGPAPKGRKQTQRQSASAGAR